MANKKQLDLELDLRANTSDGKKVVSVLTDAVNKGKEFNLTIKSTISSFSALSSKIISIAKTVGMLTDYTDTMISSQNVLNQTFGETVDTVNTYIDNLSYMTGIANTDIAKKTALFGQMATSLGMNAQQASNFSIALDDLSAKMALLFNQDFTTMSKAMLDAVKGESSTLATLTGNVLKTGALQATLDDLGLDLQANALNGANKAMLEYITIARQLNVTVQNQKGQLSDLGKVVNDVAWQKKVLKNQIKELYNALGNLLYPILRAILPVLNGILIAITTIINALASLFGVTKKTASTVSGVSTSFGDLGDNIAGASEKAKKGLRSFDKLNNITTPTPTTSTGGGATIDPELYDGFQKMQDKMLDIKNKAQEISEQILKWLGFTKDVNDNWHFTEVTLGNVLVLAGLIYFAFQLLSGFSLEKTFVSLGNLASSGGLVGAFAQIGEGIALWAGGAGSFMEVLTGFILPALGTILQIVGGVVLVAFGILEIFEGIKELKLGDYFNGILDIIIGISAIVAGIALLLGGWVVAIIAGVVLIVAEIVKHWEDIKAMFKKFGKWFDKNVIQPVMDFIRPIVDWVKEKIIDPIVAFFQPIIDAIVSIAKTIWDNITSIVGGIIEAVKSIFNKIKEIFDKIVEIFLALLWAFKEYIVKPVWDNFLEPLFNKIYEKVITPIKNVIVKVATFIYDKIIKPVWDKIKWLKDKVVGIFKTIGTVVADFIGGSIKAVINGVLWIIESTINGFLKLLNKAIKIINKIPGVEIKKVELLSIPRLETGGFVDSGQMFIARENGLPEMVGRIGNRTAVANNDQIVEAVASGVARANKMTQKDTKVVIEAEGDASGLLDFITFKQKERNRQYGM